VSEILFASATRQARLIRRGEISPVELVGAYLERIEALDGEVNSLVTVVGEQAVDQARRAQRALGREGLPPFHGVPITVKDLTETAGIRTTGSTKAYADYIGEVDAASVRRIKEAGFIILGKTNAPELGTLCVTESEVNGVCRNPWDLALTPGGSSGGAAAGLAAGFFPIAHASDGGCSIRIPASFCGLYGLKPARGRVSNGPRLGEALAGLATQGPMTRSVEDAAALLDVLAGYEAGDPYWAPAPARSFALEAGAPPGRLRVAVATTAPNFAPVDPEVAKALWEAAALLESLDHIVEEAAPEWHDEGLTPLLITVWQTLSAYAPDIDPWRMEPINRTLAQSAQATSSLDYVRALVGVQELARKIVTFWEHYDLLLTPTLPSLPVPIGWLFEDEDPWAQFAKMALLVPFVVIANFTGQPAASLPLGWSEQGLPVGVQLIGRPADEATLLRVSAQLEEARPWAGRRPPGLADH
jgi:amidase